MELGFVKVELVQAKETSGGWDILDSLPDATRVTEGFVSQFDLPNKQTKLIINAVGGVGEKGEAL